MLHLSRSGEKLPNLEAGERVGRASRMLGMQEENERGIGQAFTGGREESTVAAAEDLGTWYRESALDPVTH